MVFSSHLLFLLSFFSFRSGIGFRGSGRNVVMSGGVGRFTVFYFFFPLMPVTYFLHPMYFFFTVPFVAGLVHLMV